MFSHHKAQASMYIVFMLIRLLMINQHSGLILPKKTLKRVCHGTGGFTSNLNHTSTNKRINLSDMTHGLVVLVLQLTLGLEEGVLSLQVINVLLVCRVLPPHKLDVVSGFLQNQCPAHLEHNGIHHHTVYNTLFSTSHRLSKYPH